MHKISCPDRKTFEKLFTEEQEIAEIKESNRCIAFLHGPLELVGPNKLVCYFETRTADSHTRVNLYVLFASCCASVIKNHRLRNNVFNQTTCFDLNVSSSGDISYMYMNESRVVIQW